MNNEKPPKNEAPGARLVPAEKRGDTYIDMSAATVPNLDRLHRTIGGIAAQLGGRTSFFQKAIGVLYYPIAVIRMRRAERDMDKVAEKCEDMWREWITEARSGNVFCSFDMERLRHLHSVGRESDERFAEIDKDLVGVARVFPKSAARMRAAVSRWRQANKNLGVIMPPDDVAALQESERNLREGRSLLDLETLFNGVRGV